MTKDPKVLAAVAIGGIAILLGGTWLLGRIIHKDDPDPIAYEEDLPAVLDYDLDFEVPTDLDPVIVDTPPNVNPGPATPVDPPTTPVDPSIADNIPATNPRTPPAAPADPTPTDPGSPITPLASNDPAPPTPPAPVSPSPRPADPAPAIPAVASNTPSPNGDTPPNRPSTPEPNPIQNPRSSIQNPQSSPTPDSSLPPEPANDRTASNPPAKPSTPPAPDRGTPPTRSTPAPPVRPAVVLEMKDVDTAPGTARGSLLQRSRYLVSIDQMNAFRIVERIPPPPAEPDSNIATATWEEAVAFTAWLTQTHRAAKIIGDDAHYRLPTTRETRSTTIWRHDDRPTHNNTRRPVGIVLARGAKP